MRPPGRRSGKAIPASRPSPNCALSRRPTPTAWSLLAKEIGADLVVVGPESPRRSAWPTSWPRPAFPASAGSQSALAQLETSRAGPIRQGIFASATRPAGRRPGVACS
ncbi:hypothetical protein ACRAWD_04230 [Caulobacter segnis]